MAGGARVKIKGGVAKFNEARVVDGALLVTDVGGGGGTSDHNLLNNLGPPFDDHPQYLHLPGRAGGQVANGGTGAAEELELLGSTDAGLGRIRLSSPVTIPDVSAGDQIALRYDATFTTGGPFNGGFISSTGTVTYDNAFFIWALLAEIKTYSAAAGPGFAAFTLFNAIPTIQNSGNFDLVQALVLNVGVVHARITSGTSNVTQTIGMSFSAQARASANGAILTYTAGMTAVQFRPTFSTVAGSTVNLGTLRGLLCSSPAVGLFQPQAGTETMTAYYAVDVQAITFGGNVEKVALRSAITAATNAYFLQNTGGAQSDLQNGLLHLDDVTPIQFGGGINTQDVSLFWAAGNYFSIFFTTNNDDLRLSCPAADRFLIDNSGGSSTGEYNFNCSTFSLGAQTGANGNQVGNFVTPARTIGVAGEWADFLLTQGGNLTVGGLAMSRVSAWVINGVSYANSTGTVTEADTLTVGGFPTSSPGVTITDRQSLHVIAGRSRFDSSMQYEPISPATLAAGDTNDYGGLLTGTNNNGMRHFVRLEGDAGGTSRITGIDATQAQDGECFKLCNVSANNITLGNQNAGSAAANRIITGTGADYVLGADENCELIYDATTARWRLLYGTGA